MQDSVLKVQEVTKIYGDGCSDCGSLTGPERETNICPKCGSVVAVGGVSFDLHRAEILGIIGESGSGKSSLIRSLILDEKPTHGKAHFYDNGDQYDLYALDAICHRKLRNHRFGIVYQNPHLGLNFHYSAGGNIAERLLMADIRSYAGIRDRAGSLLGRIDFPVCRMDEKPEKFSGGMQQRVQIAKALAINPPLLFLDEVTTGLDVSVQAKILDLILELQQELHIAMVVVTHDLGVVRLLADRTLVMRFGHVVEAGLTDQILEDPQHPYTQTLVSSSFA